ncbi:MAG TPA: hypothetical protein VNK96_03230 [Fimbriimonadales bacterium]|nr:hypothetical protein [Fimbriimonadales bacterium]
MNDKSILISAGEASGDILGGALVEELRCRGFSERIFALGGKSLRAAGAEILADTSDWGALGILQSLKVSPRVFRGYSLAKKWIACNKPALVVGIDFGAMNVRLLRYAKEQGSKTLYFMPPGSWRRDIQGEDLPKIADKIATPFEWSAKILREMGGDAEWVGHPILQLVGEVSPVERKHLALLPGSRKHEILSNISTIAQVIKILERENFIGHLETTSAPKVKPVIVCAPNTDEKFLRDIWKHHSDMDVEITTSPSIEIFKRSSAAIVCSGTATLEAAVCFTPMVVLYKGSFLMELEYRIRKPKFEFIALPSILLQKRVVPEFIQRDATPERIAAEAKSLILESEKRKEQLASFEELRKLLGPEDALSRTARIALELINAPEGVS